MFKIYGVTDPKQSSHDPHIDHDIHDDHHDNSHDTHTSHVHESKQHIDVAIHNDTDHETDIGQIAVDILDTTSSIIIIAPIA
jgi:hypothetical protein